MNTPLSRMHCSEPHFYFADTENNGCVQRFDLAPKPHAFCCSPPSPHPLHSDNRQFKHQTQLQVRNVTYLWEPIQWLYFATPPKITLSDWLLFLGDVPYLKLRLVLKLTNVRWDVTMGPGPKCCLHALPLWVDTPIFTGSTWVFAARLFQLRRLSSSYGLYTSRDQTSTFAQCRADARTHKDAQNDARRRWRPFSRAIATNSEEDTVLKTVLQQNGKTQRLFLTASFPHWMTKIYILCPRGPEGT